MKVNQVKSCLHVCKRWEKFYDDNFSPPELKWKLWRLLPYKVSHSIQLHNFMYRTAYDRTIPTKVYLQRIRVVDSELCSACQYRDDLLHFLFECPRVKSFWDSLGTWRDTDEEIMNFPEDLGEEEFLRGRTSSHPSHYILRIDVGEILCI